MEVVADLHLHSKYSRAVSKQMVIPEMAKWAKIKGIDLLGTGDFTHPLWLGELKEFLVEEDGIFCLKKDQRETKFLLTAEISSIYSQGGKVRKIHNIIIAPSFAAVEKINKELQSRGANLRSDGRPIIGLSSKALAELILGIEKDCLIVPAHCLLPNENLHTKKGIKAIKEIKTGERVYTHKNRWQEVEKVLKRPFSGTVYRITPDYFRLGITVTGEHPFWAIKTIKNCRSISKTLGVCKPLCSARESCARHYFENYKKSWISAEKLQKGDVLLYPRFTRVRDKKYIKLTDYLGNFKIEENNLISLGGFRRHKTPNLIRIDKSFCRLAGLYLAEGYTSRDLVSFCFEESEKEYCYQVKKTAQEIFGIKRFKEYKRRGAKAVELTFYSKILHQFFSQFFYADSNKRRANNKCLPNWVLELPIEKQKEILIGWWQGDRGYTVSKELSNQMKVICLRLGIIPSIGKDKIDDHKRRGKHNKFEAREIKARFDTYHFSNLSFFEDRLGLLKLPIFAKYKTKMNRRRGWMDSEYIYLPVRKIEKFNYKGRVYNLEVKNDNSYTSEVACVHNCWTPWFSLYGSKSGFDSIKECFGDLSKYIFAIETGLSSDPGMNWKVADLNDKSIVSFSDAHSLHNLGREATVFEFGTERLGYEDIRKAIVGGIEDVGGIKYTIEFYPEEGKYHYSGHRNCGVVFSPKETAKRGTICPVCGRPLTKGVAERVEELSKGITGSTSVDELGLGWVKKEGRPPFIKLVPLAEIIAESFAVGLASKRVAEEYDRLIRILGSELKILMKLKLDEIACVGGEKIAEGIKKVRVGEIIIDPGYDGEYGKVRVWPSGGVFEKEKREQMGLFD